MKSESTIQDMLERVERQMVERQAGEIYEGLHDALTWVLYDYVDDDRITQYLDE